MYALPSLEFCIWGRRFQTEQSYDCLCWLAFSLGVASLVLSRHDHLFLDQAVSSKWIYLAFPAWSICVLILHPRTLLLYPPSDLIIPSCHCKLTLSSAFLQLGIWRRVSKQALRTPPSLIPLHTSNLAHSHRIRTPFSPRTRLLARTHTHKIPRGHIS